MRWKLIIFSSLIVSSVSAGVWFVAASYILHTPLFLADNWFYLQAVILILIINAVSIYIYRHTATRRKTQAFVASMLTLGLIFAFLFAFSNIINGST